MLWIAFKFCSFAIDNNSTPEGNAQNLLWIAFKFCSFAIDNNLNLLKVLLSISFV